LIKELHSTSEITDQHVENEIRTIFSKPMQNNLSFPVFIVNWRWVKNTDNTITKYIFLKWTPQQVAHLSGHSGTIYILAQVDLYEVDDDGGFEGYT